MRCVIVLSGDLRDDAVVRTWLDRADHLICADGGARHLRRLDVSPDLLVGDLDSLSPVDRIWLHSRQVPVKQYPADKDQTDSELALRQALSLLKEPRDQHELIILAAFGSRPDHVLANQLLSGQLAAEGWHLILTDGVTTQYTLTIGQELVLHLPTYQEKPLAFSVNAIGCQVDGLTGNDNLLYPLNGISLSAGSSRGISNRITQSPVVLRLSSGVALITVTPDH